MTETQPKRRSPLGPFAIINIEATEASDRIYGTILVSAVIAGASSHGEPATYVLAIAAVSVVVFYAAHVYATWLSHWSLGHLGPRAALAHSFAHHRGIIVAAIIPLACVFAGVARWIDDDTAVTLALWMGVVVLFVTGVAAGRRGGRGWAADIAVGLGAGALGMILILLNTLVH